MVECDRLDASHTEQLCQYLGSLSEASRRRFGPHGFDEITVDHILRDQQYICLGGYWHRELIAYSVIRKGIIDHDRNRLQGYGLELNDLTDCTLAPSVLDKYQGRGVGSNMLKNVISFLKSMDFKRVILWGGVQASNMAAVRLYNKYGFEELGHFEYHGDNIDMILKL